MKYYKIYHPVSKKIYGTFPNYGTDFETNSYKPNSIAKKPLFINDDIDILVPQLFQHRKSSKITSLLGTSGGTTYLIINNELKTVFESLKMFEMSFFKTTFETLDNNKLTYYFVKPKLEALESIDYNKTEFYEWENIGWMNKSRNKPLDFKGKSELLSYENRKKPMYEILKISINEKWDYDFFALKMVEDNALCFIVSEKLKDQIEKEGLTGVGFLELNTFS